jgi:hypothetical protein
MTLRLPTELAQRVALAARVEQSTFVAFVRDALEDALAFRKNDPDFQRRLADFKATEADAFRKLTGGDAS